MQQSPAQLKWMMLQAMTNFVYAAMEKRRWETLESIIRRNDIAVGMQRWVFNYAGKRWHQVRFKGVPQNVPVLADILVPEMDQYIAEGKQVEEIEKPMVQAYLRAILNSDPDPTIALLRIPTALHGPIREAIQAAEEHHGVKADMDFEQVQELVGAYGPAADAIRMRMMYNMMLE